jgi:hypothetical protein
LKFVSFFCASDVQSGTEYAFFEKFHVFRAIVTLALSVELLKLAQLFLERHFSQ